MVDSKTNGKDATMATELPNLVFWECVGSSQAREAQTIGIAGECGEREGGVEEAESRASGLRESFVHEDTFSVG